MARFYQWQPEDLENLTPKMLKDALDDLTHNPPSAF